MPAINGSMGSAPFPPPPGQFPMASPGGPIGDSSQQLSQNLAAMHVSQPNRYPNPEGPGPNIYSSGAPGQPMVPGPPPPGPPSSYATGPPGLPPGSQPTFVNAPTQNSVTSLSGPMPPPTGSNGMPPPRMSAGPINNSSQPLPTSRPSPMSFGQPMMNRESSPSYQPQGLGQQYMGGPAGPVPPSSMPGNMMPPPMSSSQQTMSGTFPGPPTSSNAMGMPPPPHSGPRPMAPYGGGPQMSQFNNQRPMPPSLNPPGQPMMAPPGQPFPPNANIRGSTPAPVGPGQYPQTNMAAQPQPRRLDPDHMPSVIQVIDNDKQQRSGVFSTAQRGVTPPLVTTEFVVQDHGNCSPRFIRSTLYNIPASNDLMKQMSVPFALNITPFAKIPENEATVQITDMGPQGPVRCNRCKAYMSPFMTFIDGGRRFQCALCGGCTDVPVEYFAHLDHTGRRVDCSNRPELWSGSYEIIATKEYCKGNVMPQPPAFVFMLDVSYNSVKSGLTRLLCQHLKSDIFPNLPRETFADGSQSEPRIGFVTYDRDIHFYNLKPCLSQPQMQVVSDMEDVFVPLVDGFLVSPAEADTLVDSLMELVPMQFDETRRTETVLGPAIQAGMEALKAANCSGKLFVFHTSLPIAEAPGKLKNRDDRKLLGTEKEKVRVRLIITVFCR